MNVSFFITILAEIITAVILTEALPGWRSNRHSKQRSWHIHRGVRSDGCHSGQCVQAWKCPDTAISSKPTGSCAYWENGPWVCCILTEDSRFTEPIDTQKESHKFTTKVPDVSSELHPKQIEKYIWKQKAPGSHTKPNWKNSEDSWNEAPCVDDTGDSYGRNNGINPISSSGDLPANTWDKANEDGFWDEPTEFPDFDEWMKSTKNVWNKWTTSKPQNSWTTKRKPSTSESRIIFPTVVPSWTKKTTKRSTSSTSSWEKTSYVYDQKTTAKPWAQPSRTTTKRSWIANPTTTRKTTTRTTRPVNTRKPVLSTKASNDAGSGSEDRRNQGPGRSTLSYPDREPKTEPRNVYTQNPRDSTTRRTITTQNPRGSTTRRTTSTQNPRASTTRRTTTTQNPRGSTTRSTTTRRNRVTTPLPNVNTYYCGIRDLSPISNRRARENNPEAEFVYTGPRNSRGREPFQRIVGGEEAEPFSWPWVAALYKVSASGHNRFLSAGSLINENFVLTAAHPFTKDDIRSSSYTVMLGTHNAEDSIAQYIVSSVLQHPEYEQRYYYHDIALLRLERPVEFNDFVMPVCLPSPDAPLLRDRDIEGKNVTVMGWGDESFGGRTSRVLKEATFPIVSRRSCNESYVRVASNRFPRGITENMLCAGAPNGGKDACQGDSGGPLTSVERGRYTQVGIVSFGYQCGDKEFPGVYTKVAPYLSWIAENTERVRDSDYGYNG